MLRRSRPFTIHVDWWPPLLVVFIMISLWVMLILRNDDDNRAAIQDSTIMRLLVFNEHGEFLSSSWPRPEPWKIVAARDFLARKPASAIEELVVGRPPDPSQRKDWSLPIIYRPGQQAVMGGIFVMAVIDTRHFVQHFERMQPVSYVKIDRSFINNIRNDINDATIVSSTISLCHNLNLQSIAEGVETREQLAHLRAAGCDQAQGYLFSRPLPPEEIPALLQEYIYQDQTQGEKNAPSSGAL